VAEIGRQGQHLLSDVSAFFIPAQESEHGEGVARVMNAWPPGATLSRPSQAAPDAAKRRLYGVGHQLRSALCTEEETRGIAVHERIAISGVLLECLCRTRMQRNTSGFAKLGLPYRQQAPL